MHVLCPPHAGGCGGNQDQHTAMHVLCPPHAGCVGKPGSTHGDARAIIALSIKPVICGGGTRSLHDGYGPNQTAPCAVLPLSRGSTCTVPNILTYSYVYIERERIHIQGNENAPTKGKELDLAAPESNAFFFIKKI